MSGHVENDKGLTLVELIVVMSIVGMVIVTIGDYLATNVRSYAREENQIEAQHSAQTAIEKIERLAIGAQGVSSEPEFDAGGTLGTVKFKNGNGTESEVKLVGGALTIDGARVADGLSSVVVTPEPGTSLAGADGVKISVSAASGGEQANVSSMIYFRNK